MTDRLTSLPHAIKHQRRLAKNREVQYVQYFARTYLTYPPPPTTAKRNIYILRIYTFTQLMGGLGCSPSIAPRVRTANRIRKTYPRSENFDLIKIVSFRSHAELPVFGVRAQMPSVTHRRRLLLSRGPENRKRFENVHR